jgi:ribosomal protein S18 acetylase RimI-like enzyme
LIQDYNKTPIFVAEADGVVVGYAFCQVIRESDNSRVQNTLYIDDLCVDENLRGCHVGSDLLNFVVNYAKENNFYNITLNVWVLNEKALKFYEKHGMHIQKYGMEKIV